MQSSEKQVNNIKAQSGETQQSNINTQENSANESLVKNRLIDHIKCIVVGGKIYTAEDFLSERGK